MKISIQIITLIIITAGGTAFAQQAITAEDAIRIGLENNYNIRIARSNAEIAANNRGQGSADFSPRSAHRGRTGLSTSDQESNNPISGSGRSDITNITGQVALSWTLFDGFRMFASNRQLRALAELGEATARDQIETLVVSILDSYFNLVQQEQLLEVQQESIDISRQRLEKERVRREVGGSSSTDLLNAQVSYNTDRANFINQELNVITARQRLNLQLARDPADPIMVSKEFTIPALDMAFPELVELAEAHNSTLQSAYHSLDAARAGIGAARSAFMPQLNLNASYGRSDRTTQSDVVTQFRPAEQNTISTDGAVSLSLSWNLFNGFRDDIALQNARINEKINALALENARNILRGSLQEKLVTYYKQLELLALEQENVQASRQNLALQEERLQLGAATSLEFRDAQVNLIRAQSELITARFQARTTRLDIDRLTGLLSVE